MKKEREYKYYNPSYPKEAPRVARYLMENASEGTPERIKEYIEKELTAKRFDSRVTVEDFAQQLQNVSVQLIQAGNLEVFGRIWNAVLNVDTCHFDMHEDSMKSFREYRGSTMAQVILATQDQTRDAEATRNYLGELLRNLIDRRQSCWVDDYDLLVRDRALYESALMYVGFKDSDHVYLRRIDNGLESFRRQAAEAAEAAEQGNRGGRLQVPGGDEGEAEGPSMRGPRHALPERLPPEEQGQGRAAAPGARPLEEQGQGRAAAPEAPPLEEQGHGSAAAPEAPPPGEQGHGSAAASEAHPPGQQGHGSAAASGTHPPGEQGHGSAAASGTHPPGEQGHGSAAASESPSPEEKGHGSAAMSAAEPVIITDSSTESYGAEPSDSGQATEQDHISPAPSVPNQASQVIVISSSSESCESEPSGAGQTGGQDNRSPAPSMPREPSPASEIDPSTGQRRRSVITGTWTIGKPGRGRTDRR